MASPLPEAFGPYRVIEELGRGGMGIVYRARRDDLDREVALKLVVPGSGTAHDDESLVRLQREARAAAQLADIAGIVGVHDVGEHEGQIYLAMDLVEGRSLDDVLRDDDWAPHQAADCIAQVAEALEHAHARGLLHRDVKPANVMLETGTGQGSACPRAHLTDFGLAKWTRADGELSRLTVSGAILGTPAYMAPEQARGESLDARADVYALGVTLYEALAGRPPFEGDTMLAVLNRVLRDPPPPLHRARPGIPRALVAIVHRAMAKAAADRYPSAGALAADLRRFLQGEPVQARLPGGVARVVAAVRRRRAASAVVAVAAVGGIAAAIALPLWREREAGNTRELHASEAEGVAVDELGSALTAYRALVQRTLSHMQRLEDGWRMVRVAPEAQAEALAAVDAAVAEVQAAHPGARGPAAWGALAHGFANEPAALTALRELGRSPAADPIPALLLTQVLLARYGSEATLPEIAMRTGEQVTGRYMESGSQRDWREQALAALRLVQGLPGWAKLEEAGRYADLARGAEALAAGNHAEAAEAFAKVKDDPLLGPTASDLEGLTLYAAGRYGAAAKAWERAAERGWPAAMVNAANAWVSQGVELGLQDTPQAEPYERAIALLGRAMPIAARPDHVLSARASARMFLAAAVPRLRAAPPEEVDGMLASAVDDFRLALEQLDSADSYGGLGQGLMQLAQHRRRNGQDPRALLAEAATALTTAVTMEPAHWVARLNRAMVYRLQAEILGPTGDADGLFAQGLADLAILTTMQAPAYAVGIEVASTHLARGRVRLGFTSSDPEPSLRAAIDACTNALKERPGAVQALQSRAGAHEALGRCVARRQEDPSPHFAAAEADLTRALEHAPGEPSLWRDRGVVRYRRSAEGADVADRLAALAGARADYEESARRGPAHAGIHLNVANTWLSEGDTLQRVQRDPTAAWRAAEAGYSEALRLNPRDGRVWSMRARLRQMQAGHLQGQGQPWDERAAAALADYDAAITHMPRAPEPWGQRARLLAGLGRLAEAEKALEQAVRLSDGARGWTDLLAKVRRDLAAGK